jgi:hypothetical protein
LRDLNKQKFEFRKSLAPATVLDGIQLVYGENCSMEKKVQTMRAGWASDPVHPNGHIYAKMALNLIEKIAVSSGPQAAVTGGRKRSWSSSNRDEQTQGSSSNLRQGDRFGGGAGGNGGGSGGRDSRRSDSYDGGNRGTGNTAGRSTNRSSDWKMRGASNAYGQPGRGGTQHYGGGSGHGGGGGGDNGGRFGGARGYFGGGGTGGFGAGRGGYRY